MAFAKRGVNIRGKRSLARFGLVSLSVIAALTSPACSLVVDTDTAQCTDDLACQTRGGAFASSACVNAVCVPSCLGNSDCSARLATPALCVRPTGSTSTGTSIGRCVALASEDCKQVFVEKDATADDTFWIGALLPLLGDDADSGITQLNAMELARRDLVKTAGGLPKTTGARPRSLGILACNDVADPERAARHLAVELGLPAIVGPAFSGVTIKVATNVTIPAGTLIISGSATSPYISSLDDRNLVWRTAPSDSIQSVAISLLIKEDIEPSLKVGADPIIKPGRTVRVAVAHKGDAYGTGLARELGNTLTFNGKSPADNGKDYALVDYGDPSASGAEDRFAASVRTLIEAKPHIIILVGTAEAALKIFAPLEASWPTTEPRPRYVMADGLLIPQLTAAVKSTEVRRRILGTVPGTTDKSFQAFSLAYQSAFRGSNPNQYSAFAYDATYMLMYGVASIPGVVTGASLAASFARMVPPGTPVDAGPEGISNTFMLIARGENFDLNGASGPLDFDLKIGEAPSDIQIWCLDADMATPAKDGIYSGQYYDSRQKRLAGARTKCP